MGALYANPVNRASSAPMDVLRDAAARLPKGKWEAGASAIAAVVALIEVCEHATCQCPRGAWRTAEHPYGQHQRDCHLAGIPAALARIGGAA
ncbi:hypothetical protein [Frateuria sp. YIM B11624]|uniref:hypothetical protein n=1 Tax=Frateuria sp. YIM B11624 TaxID=3143185 RepID=UPI003C774598